MISELHISFLHNTQCRYTWYLSQHVHFGTITRRECLFLIVHTIGMLELTFYASEVLNVSDFVCTLY